MKSPGRAVGAAGNPQTTYAVLVRLFGHRDDHSDFMYPFGVALAGGTDWSA
jgi:hypothetical protein